MRVERVERRSHYYCTPRISLHIIIDHFYVAISAKL
jgi:hypothetical protein